MKVLYFIPANSGHFAHLYPFYKNLGGLFLVSERSVKKKILGEYPDINITESISYAEEYNPDVILYPDFYLLDKFKKAKHVQVFHGVSDKLYYYTADSSIALPKYDLCLLTGKVMQHKLDVFGWETKSKIIGYPKFDYLQKVKTDPFKDKNKKTILYAPTFSTYSSLKVFHRAIKKLSEKYNVIIKIHDRASSCEKCREYVDYLIKNVSDGLRVYDNINILSFINDCDALITDVSAVAYESLYYNKPIIIANPNPGFYKPWKHILRQTYIWNIAEVCDDPDFLTEAVDNAIDNDDKIKGRAKVFAQTFYCNEKETATQRGAEAIQELFK